MLATKYAITKEVKPNTKQLAVKEMCGPEEGQDENGSGQEMAAVVR